MGSERPDLHTAFVLKVEIIQKKERYKNKEDSLGGPGYYPQEEVVASFYKEIPQHNLRRNVNAVARGELRNIL